MHIMPRLMSANDLQRLAIPASYKNKSYAAIRRTMYVAAACIGNRWYIQLPLSSAAIFLASHLFW